MDAIATVAAVSPFGCVSMMVSRRPLPKCDSGRGTSLCARCAAVVIGSEGKGGFLSGVDVENAGLLLAFTCDCTYSYNQLWLYIGVQVMKTASSVLIADVIHSRRE